MPTLIHATVGRKGIHMHARVPAVIETVSCTFLLVDSYTSPNEALLVRGTHFLLGSISATIATCYILRNFIDIRLFGQSVKHFVT